MDSTSDSRTVNNVVRHEYRVLTDAEKQQMKQIKDLGADFLAEIDKLDDSREVELARVKIEEAVMWAVKHITR